MSRRARQREAQDRELQQLYESDWREDRDRDDEDVPEPDPDEPVNTFH